MTRVRDSRSGRRPAISFAVALDRASQVGLRIFKKRKLSFAYIKKHTSERKKLHQVKLHSWGPHLLGPKLDALGEGFEWGEVARLRLTQDGHDGQEPRLGELRRDATQVLSDHAQGGLHVEAKARYIRGSSTPTALRGPYLRARRPECDLVEGAPSLSSTRGVVLPGKPELAWGAQENQTRPCIKSPDSTRPP